MHAGGWLAAFPQEDARAVVGTLCTVWKELAVLSPETFHPGVPEPKLTELLCEQIRAVFKARTKLTGQWSYERRAAIVVKQQSGSLAISNRSRTDIEYFSDRYGHPFELIFEFKKLNNSQKRRDLYIGEEGMFRFVTGKYSVKQSAATMVGILLKAEEDCLPPLVKLLQTPEVRSALKIKVPVDKAVEIPSQLFPANARFDTEHHREAGLAPPHGILIISHIFLGFETA
jgi:hypothetical protein